MENDLQQQLSQARHMAKLWKRAAKRKRAAASNGHVESVPRHIDVRPQQTAEMLNVGMYSATKLFEATARLRACASEAIGILCSQHKDIVFHAPLPMSMTRLLFWWIKGAQPPEADMMDVWEDIGKTDQELILVIVDGLKTRLGLK